MIIIIIVITVTLGPLFYNFLNMISFQDNNFTTYNRLKHFQQFNYENKSIEITHMDY